MIEGKGIATLKVDGSAAMYQSKKIKGKDIIHAENSSLTAPPKPITIQKGAMINRKRLVKKLFMIFQMI